MKILHIISGDLWGGAESLVFNLVREISEEPNIEVSVLLFNHGILEKRLKSSGINVEIIDENSTPQLILLYKSYLYIRSLKPEIIHTHKHKENVIGSFASLATRIPSLRTAHGDTESNITPADGLKYLYKLLNIFSGRYVQHRIVAVSNDLKIKLSKQYPLKNITLIPNGIEIKTIDKPKLNEHLQKGKINIAIICRLVPVKRVDIFLAIANSISKLYPDRFHFFIYGDGPLENKLKSLSDDYGITKQVTFMGFIQDLGNYYPDIDILMITSDHEGLPMNLLESIVYKIPVISHDVGDIKNVLCGGKCGILIDSQNPSEFTQAILRLADNPESIERFTQKALENVTQNYSLENTTKQYIDLYSSLLH